MKKIRIFSLMFVAMFILTSFAVFADYSLDDYPFDASREYPRVQMKAYEGTPSIDADITDSEGWSGAVSLNHNNMVQFWNPSSRCIINADVRFAWDSEGLYIAADITDPTMVASKGEDEPNASGVNEYGWDGDVFVFALDPMKQFMNEGYASEKDWRSAWYCFSVNEAGKLMCYATNTGNSGDITNRIEGVATLTDGGWKFEAMLTWDRLAMDVESVTNSELTIDAEEFTQLGIVSNAGFIYMDKAVNDGIVSIFTNDEVEEGEIFVLSRNICVPVVHDDGMDYNDGGASARSYGAELTITDNTGYAPEVVIDDPDPEENPDDGDTSSDTQEEPDESVDLITTVPNTSEPTSESSAPLVTSPGKTEVTTFNTNSVNNPGGGNGIPTGLIGIIVGVVVIAVAVVVIIVVKKKKSK